VPRRRAVFRIWGEIPPGRTFGIIERREWWLWWQRLSSRATHNRASVISAPEFVIAPGLPRSITFFRQAVRGLVALVFCSISTPSISICKSQDSPPTDRTRRALSFDQRKCGGHDCGRDLEGRRIFNSISYQKYWGIRLKNFRSHPGSSRFIRKTASGLRMLPRKPTIGMGTILEYRFRHKNGIGWCWIRCKRHRNEKGRAGETSGREPRHYRA